MLPARVVSIAVAASFSLRPTRPASERSTSTFKRRLLEGLLDARVGDAGNALDPRQHCVGVGSVRCQIVADHLQIDRRRRAEVQDLADHVGGQERRRSRRETGAAAARASS